MLCASSIRSISLFQILHLHLSQPSLFIYFFTTFNSLNFHFFSKHSTPYLNSTPFFASVAHHSSLQFLSQSLVSTLQWFLSVSEFSLESEQHALKFCLDFIMVSSLPWEESMPPQSNTPHSISHYIY